MTNTIPNVPRELLEELRDAANESMNATTRQHQIDHFAGLIAKADALLSAPSPANHVEDVRAMVADPSPAGVDGLEVVGWYTEDHLDDKSATTYSREVADRWLAKGWPVNGIANAAAAQAIIDGLRGEVAELESTLADNLELSGKRAVRIAEIGHELADAISERDQQAQRIGELEGLLRHAQKQVPTGSGLHMRIDAALSAGKEGE